MKVLGGRSAGSATACSERSTGQLRGDGGVGGGVWGGGQVVGMHAWVVDVYGGGVGLGVKGGTDLMMPAAGEGKALMHLWSRVGGCAIREARLWREGATAASDDRPGTLSGGWLDSPRVRQKKSADGRAAIEPPPHITHASQKMCPQGSVRAAFLPGGRPYGSQQVSHSSSASRSVRRTMAAAGRVSGSA